MPDNWKPLSTAGPGVSEIRLRNSDGAFRVIYLAKLETAVYVLHVFQKKTEQLELARKRFGELKRR